MEDRLGARPNERISSVQASSSKDFVSIDRKRFPKYIFLQASQLLGTSTSLKPKTVEC